MRIDVLDHGYVQLVECYGSDERIVEAARMSTDKGFKGWGGKHRPDCESLLPFDGVNDPVPCACDMTPGDEKLLRYLYEHAHMTPFEMAGMIIEVQAPIFVFREWHRHRTQSYNEMSARYVPLPDVNYLPTVERIMASGGHNKQAQGSQVVNPHEAAVFRGALGMLYQVVQEKYEDAIANGIPKELARLMLPVGRYSKMRASANLRNWLHFLTLRMDENAQWEIRQYANAVGAMIATKFPRTWELFEEERKA